jgi:hypothetical protein
LANLENTIRRYSPLVFLLVLLVTIAAGRSNWMPADAKEELPREPGYVKIPAGAQVFGDFDVLYPPGGLKTVSRQPHPVLEVEGWSVSISASIQNISFLLDGKPVQPMDAYPMRRSDVAEMFDHLDFYYSGWHMDLPLNDLGPGPHFLTLQITLSGGLIEKFKRIELH